MTKGQDFIIGTQMRKSPLFDATLRWGVESFSVYNHMYLSRSFGSEVENFTIWWTSGARAGLPAAKAQIPINGIYSPMEHGSAGSRRQSIRPGWRKISRWL